MLVLGIDPGSVNTAIAWIRGDDKDILKSSFRSAATFNIRNSGTMTLRWARLGGKLDNAMKNFLPEPPVTIAVEEPIRERCTNPINLKEQHVLYGSYAIVVSTIARLFPESTLMPIRYMSWAGGITKGDVQARLSAKYRRETFRTEDEVDALGIADFAWGIVAPRRRRELELGGKVVNPSP